MTGYEKRGLALMVFSVIAGGLSILLICIGHNLCNWLNLISNACTFWVGWMIYNRV